MPEPSVPIAVRLRLYFQPAEANRYQVQVYLNIPANEELKLTADDPVLVQFDADELRQRQDDEEAYGQWLGAVLFSDDLLREGLQQAQQLARRMELPLQIEIDISRRAAGLRQIAWERLRAPADGSLLEAVVLAAPPAPAVPTAAAEAEPEPEPDMPSERVPDPRLTEAILLLGFLVLVFSLCPLFLGLVSWFDIGVFGDEAGPVLGIAMRIYLFFFVLLLLLGMWLMRLGLQRDAAYRKMKNITVSPRMRDWGS